MESACTGVAVARLEKSVTMRFQLNPKRGIIMGNSKQRRHISVNADTTRSVTNRAPCNLLGYGVGHTRFLSATPEYVQQPRHIVDNRMFIAVSKRHVSLGRVNRFTQAFQ